MKKTLLVVFATVALTAVAGCDAGKCAPRQKAVFGEAKGAVELPEPGRELVGMRFNDGPGNWVVGNYKDILEVKTVGSGEDAAIGFSNQTTQRDTAWSLKSPTFAVKPHAEIAVVVVARGTVSMLAPFNHGGMATAVFWLDADGKPVLAQDVDGKMKPTGLAFGFRSQGDAWLKTVVKGWVPQEARNARVVLGGDVPDIPGKGAGRIEIKSARVLEREGGGSWDFGDMEAPEIAPAELRPLACDGEPIRFTVKDASPLDRASFKCEIDGKDVTAKVRHLGDGKFEYQSESPWERDRIYWFGVSAKDVFGNFQTTRVPYFFGEAPASSPATVRADGMTVVDGKPFFPIGIFAVRKGAFNGENIDRAVRELKEIGMNTLHTYSRHPADPQVYEGFLDACDKHGMRSVVESTTRNYTAKNHADEMRATLVAGRRHPSLLAWCIGDDTASHRRASEVLADHWLSHAMDGARLTTQADGGNYAGRYYPFAKATDTFILELYPYRAATPEPDGLARLVMAVNNTMTDMKRAGATNRGVWALVQAFDGWNLWKRFPTREEIRAMSYLSVIHGCRGVLYYTYLSGSRKHGVASDPKQFATLAAVTKELASIEADLASPDAKDQPAVAIMSGPAKDLCGATSVSCLVKDGPFGPLLMAANATTEAVKARIGVKAKGPAQVLFENREVQVGAGGIVDEFAPGAVHVYRIK